MFMLFELTDDMPSLAGICMDMILGTSQWMDFKTGRVMGMGIRNRQIADQNHLRRLGRLRFPLFQSANVYVFPIVTYIPVTVSCHFRKCAYKARLITAIGMLVQFRNFTDQRFGFGIASGAMDMIGAIDFTDQS